MRSGQGAAEGVVNVGPEDDQKCDCPLKVGSKRDELQVSPGTEFLGTIGLAEGHHDVKVKLRRAQGVYLGVLVFGVYRDLAVAILQVNFEIPRDLCQQPHPSLE